jgi:hypothetical protein
VSSEPLLRVGACARQAMSEFLDLMTAGANFYTSLCRPSKVLASMEAKRLSPLLSQKIHLIQCYWLESMT